MNDTLSITLSHQEIYLKVGTWYYEVSATVNSPCPECVSLTWHSSDSSIASVGASNGYIHANGVGTATIYATATDHFGNSCTNSLTVTVSQPILASSVTLNRENISLAIGTYTTLSATVLPENTTNDSVTWCSSNPCVASVSGGTVFAHAEGEAIIRATTADGSGKTAECTVTVYSYIPVTGLEISSAPQTMNVGDTTTLTATVCPCNATNTCVTWTSNNTTVAEIEPYTGNVTAKNPGIATITVTAFDSNHIATCEVWVHGKTPVFLIHGRTSHSNATWGVRTNIPSGANDDFDPNIDAEFVNNKKYVDVDSQKIVDVIAGDSDNADTPCNLGYELQNAGYEKNVTLFAFNYPNEDTVIHSAKKFEKHIENLIDYVRTSGTDEMKACFYASRNDYDNNNYKINIVGHSIGGLVARYFIENLYQDNHVEKLITICTPHWGSPLAELSNSTGILHKLCDHDLDVKSAMYGGENEAELKEGCTLWEITDLWHECTDDKYILTDELRYNKSRFTQYYAIAGIDYNSDGMSDNNFNLELQNTNASYTEINDEIIQRSQDKLYVWIQTNDIAMRFPFNVAYLRDNVVTFFSQIGWSSLNESGLPNKKINFKKTFVNIDTDGGNSLTSHFHGKMPFRKEVTDKTIEYLEE